VRIDPAAIVQNWRTVSALAPGAETAAVVKADAYGHGVAIAAPALARAGCRSFFVATVAEGLELRALLGPGPRILVLNGLALVESGGLAGVAAADLTPVLNSLAEIAAWEGRGPWALHLDTGMNRLGLSLAELGPAQQLAGVAQPFLVMSHLACADTPEHPLNANQRQAFVQAAATAFPKAARSLAATGGVALGAGYHFELVRPGLALYGVWDTTAAAPPLAPAMTVEAPLLQLRWIEAGESVGYGARYVAASRQRLGVIALGYADGCLRSLSNRGYGAIEGAVCPIRGRVSMDLLVLDVTAAGARAEVGSVVELLGRQAPAAAQAQLGGTIAYELFTALGTAAARAGARSAQ
jgi:alanine racemase